MKSVVAILVAAVVLVAAMPAAASKQEYRPLQDFVGVAVAPAGTTKTSETGQGSGFQANLPYEDEDGKIYGMGGVRFVLENPAPSLASVNITVTGGVSGMRVTVPSTTAGSGPFAGEPLTCITITPVMVKCGLPFGTKSFTVHVYEDLNVEIHAHVWRYVIVA